MLLALSSLAVGWTALGPPPCAFRRTVAPIAAAEWEDCAGCKLLRPSGKPRALVHFLGGVFVSPAPQVAYRYLLEQLADRGYLVVATPYAVEFDYTKPAADVKRKLDAARAALAAESSAELPLVSLGHSLGALMQTLLACTYADFADTCAGSVLVSWNNKPVSDAIPLFEQLFVPALGPLNGPLEQAVAAVAPASELRRDGLGPLEAEYLPISPRISPYLPVSRSCGGTDSALWKRNICPYLPVSPRISELRRDGLGPLEAE